MTSRADVDCGGYRPGGPARDRKEPRITSAALVRTQALVIPGLVSIPAALRAARRNLCAFSAAPWLRVKPQVQSLDTRRTVGDTDIEGLTDVLYYRILNA
jgi:hypothetical protein